MLIPKQLTFFVCLVGQLTFFFFFAWLVLFLKMLCFHFSICLEWNGLGLLETSFAAFCDGLAANSALRALDLRNNQINHEGAEELSAALKRNITLRALGTNECFASQHH